MLTQMRTHILTRYRRYPLRWHLGLLLLIKITLLYIIWLAWFSHPVSFQPQQVAADLLTADSVISCNQKDTCNASQP